MKFLCWSCYVGEWTFEIGAVSRCYEVSAVRSLVVGNVAVSCHLLLPRSRENSLFSKLVMLIIGRQNIHAPSRGFEVSAVHSLFLENYPSVATCCWLLLQLRSAKF